MADLLLSNQHPFQSEDLYVLLPCHMMDVGQVYASSAFRLLWNHFYSWGTNFRGFHGWLIHEIKNPTNNET